MDIITDPMINALLLIYNFLGPELGLPGAFGLAIIVFTILVRLVTLPLTLQQQRSTQKMQELQQDKRWKKLQEKYKDNKQKLQEEQLKLYQEMGINPFAGCLPTLIQLPIIFGLYGAIISALGNSPYQILEFSQHLYSMVPSSILPLNSTFLWMDLGQPERLPVPFLSGVPLLEQGIPVLAIIVVITSYISTKLITPPSTGDQASGMSSIMGIYMPLFLGYFAYTLASGLAIYFVISNLLQIVQSAATGRIDWRSLLPGSKAPAES